MISKEFGLGSPDGFQFNMSCGYNLEGIKDKKIDDFIEGMKDARDTEIFRECRTWLLEHIALFEHVTREDIEAIPSEICNSITLSTCLLYTSRYVFQDKCETFKDHIRPFCKFISARLVTMVIEVGGVWLLVEVCKMNDMAGKFITQFIVLALNYIFSKFFVFTTGKSKKSDLTD